MSLPNLSLKTIKSSSATPITTKKLSSVLKNTSSNNNKLPPLIVTQIATPEEGSQTSEETAASSSPTITDTTTGISTLSSAKDLQDTSRNSDSGKSSSCSPTLLDCSFDSGIAGVLIDTGDMQLHKRIQQYQRILLALEREREHFSSLRSRLSKISDRKKKALDGAEYLCNVCCADIDPEDAKTFVKCYICQKHICRSIKCADWLPKTAQWECELCQSSKHSMAQTSSWVADQQSFNQQKLVYPMRARSEIFIPITERNDGSMHFESVSQIGATSAVITPEQKLKIREYVEELVAKMLGGNLDTIAVNQLSRSENYLPAKTNGHVQHHHHPHNHPHIYTNGSISHGDGLGSRESTPGPDFTDLSEARLRNMIQKIISETIDMPPLSKTYAVSEIALDRPSKMADMNLTNGVGLRRHRTEHYFEPTIYQDLLATAVLNKIVDKQSNNNRNMTESSPNLTRVMADGAEDVGGIVEGAGDMDQNYNMENQSITSGSSVEPRSDLSYTDTEPNVTTNEEKSSELLLNAGRESVMSDYLATHMVPLPDLSVVATESEMEDDYMSVTSSAVGDSAWENNWLFKKKKPSLAGGSISTSSVGMLVPDPKEDVRAQIGDKTADEISDLSELGSDTDDSSMDLLRANMDPVNNRLFNKHLIGGQNSKMVLDELIERSSMISNTLPLDQEEAYAETRNVDVDVPSKNEAINTNVSQQNNNNNNSDNNNQEDQENLEVLNPPLGFGDHSSSNPLAGSIAEREYKKWYNAVEMPNNPYAPEALKRRISGSQERFIDLPNINASTDLSPLEMLTKEKVEADEANQRENEYRRYSRDYYINDGSAKSSQVSSPVRDMSNKDVTEVNKPNNHNPSNNMNKNTFENHTNSNSNSKRKTNTNDCHWTLSTPVRRASSLKYLNHSLTSPPPTMPYQRLSIGSRPATSASNYPSNDDQYLRQHHHRYSNRNYRYNNPEDYYNIGDNDDDDDDDEGVDDPQLDLISQRSWKSSTALNATTKRRTLSMLSVFSGNSSRCGSVVSSRSRSQQPDSNVLTQFEKQLLHKDLKRNSFRAVSATTKDFVMNPLFEKQQQEFFNGEGGLKLSIAKPKRSQEEDYDDRRRDEEFTRQQGDDQGGDSGVDSCLNGFSEKARDEGKLKIVDDGFIF